MKCYAFALDQMTVIRKPELVMEIEKTKGFLAVTTSIQGKATLLYDTVRHRDKAYKQFKKYGAEIINRTAYIDESEITEHDMVKADVEFTLENELSELNKLNRILENKIKEKNAEIVRLRNKVNDNTGTKDKIIDRLESIIKERDNKIKALSKEILVLDHRIDELVEMKNIE